MSRPLGGYIGHTPVPAAAGINSAAGGMWTLREAQRLKQAATWPNAFVDPTSITGLQLWLDASDASTLFSATTGGSLVAADGAVARWEDKSGNGRHFTQSTAGSRPARKTNQQNGRDALLFDGSNDHLIGGDYLDLNGTNQITIFLALKTLTSNASNLEILNKRDDTGTDSGWYVNLGATSKLSFALVNNATYFVLDSNSAVSANNGAVLSFKTIAGSPSSSQSQYRNGSLVASTVSFNETSSAANISKAVYLGILDFAGTLYRPFAGNFCEVIIYNAALSDANRSVVESYLMSKWGIA